MLRWLVIAVALAACAKRGKDAAPESRATPVTTPVTGGQPPTISDPNAPPPPPDRERALENTRNQASLGPSAPTSSFDPIDKAPDKVTKGDGKRVDPGDVSGGPPAQIKEDPKTLLHARIGAVTLAGKPAPEALTRALKVRVSEVQACYDRLSIHPTKPGTLKLSFKVVESGHLVAATVDAASTVKNIDLESCVVGVIQKLTVPKELGTENPNGTVVITFVVLR